MNSRRSFGFGTPFPESYRKRDAAPHDDAPAAKNPRLARMTAQRPSRLLPPEPQSEEDALLDASIKENYEEVAGAAQKVLQVADNDKIEKLTRKIRAHKFEWGLHATLHLPVCRCEQICQPYVQHLTERAAEEDYIVDGMEDIEEESSGEYGFVSALMEDLFLLRDLYTRMAAWKYNHEDPRGVGELQGFLLKAQADLLKLQGERDEALCKHASATTVMQKEIEAMNHVHEELKTQLQSLTDELQSASVALNDARCNAGIAASEAEALKDTVGTLSRKYEHALVSSARAFTIAQTEIDNEKRARVEVETRLQSALDELSCVKRELELRKGRLETSLFAALVTKLLSPPTDTASTSKYSSYDWSNMKIPPRDQPIETLARWIQFHQPSMRGIILHEPNCTIDKRDLRGYREVQSRLSFATKERPSQAARKGRARVEFLIIQLLATPGQYASSLLRTNTPISQTVTYTTLDFEIQNEEELAKLLAAQGLALAVADDAHQYAYNYLTAVANSGDAAAQMRLTVINTQGSPPPPGLYPPENDRFPRPADLPYTS
ncbi:hypothetical protein C8R46DRAFT_1218111 [Mycena filopes]|nr:hypothetical protein C8R46DRAFT_1218111 [Mycena filopes]